MTTGLQEQRERAIRFGIPDRPPTLAEIRAYAIGEAIGRKDVSKSARRPTPEALRQLANVVFDGRGAIGDALAQLGREIVVQKAIELDRELRPNSGEKVDSRNDCMDSLFRGVFTLKRCRG